MSHLSNELAAVAQKNGILQIEVTNKTGLSVAHVSRIFNAKQTTITDDDLEKFISVVARSTEDRARLIRARMLDAYTGPGAELVEIRLKAGASKEKESWPKVSIDPGIKAAFVYLYRLVPKNPLVGQSILQMARMMGMRA